MSTDLDLEQTVAIAKTPSQPAFMNAKRGKGATTYDFKVRISSGSLTGKTFEGSFSYNASTLSGEGFETIGLAQGLNVSFNFLNHKYSEADDVRLPDSPVLQFKDGELSGLKYAPFDFIFHLNSQSDQSQSAFTYDVSAGEGEGQVSYVQRESAASTQSTPNLTGLAFSGLSWLLRKKAVSPQKA
ncbi:hypothetical protein H6G00_13515 [Leptolyngbya sp. FACHB-541]|uniref:hypothetical protein n=1 Tax=Leptolyngbya sp. FACHB-541 TaxID=2692810 RepID=UPI00168901C8|nr:hypothetical protein [Leptolyngbya sp. FACHB-541]MBD1997633.1 hypothetical protein [Leptolyngbya sp. FACHB-541]